MKRLLEDFERSRNLHFWRSWNTWLFLGSLVLIVTGLVWMVMVAQRRDYQRTSDAGLAHAIEEIRSEVRSLRATVEKSAADRQQIRRDVDRVKEAVER